MSATTQGYIFQLSLTRAMLSSSVLASFAAAESVHTERCHCVRSLQQRKQESPEGSVTSAFAVFASPFMIIRIICASLHFVFLTILFTLILPNSILRNLNKAFVTCNRASVTIRFHPITTEIGFLDHLIMNPNAYGFGLVSVTCPQSHEKNRRTRRSIQRRATSFFEFGLPSPPWMSYSAKTRA